MREGNYIKRPIIDMKTLKIYKSISSCARELGVSKNSVFNKIESRCFQKQYINHNKRAIIKERFEYLDEWLTGYDDWEKRANCIDKNIDFYVFSSI